ncbi:hypothetical protein PHMEG_00017928 [Phytophthora megakarya]|uniref:Myb/SANT-like domain-containing protein n=1 Tax=Phytophthora megakarya TaxID=4795 RepID=A0A225VVA7_9STRA|nr:hypothetical protein PHMEG_00017928 [Phytophthora megakarya]
MAGKDGHGASSKVHLTREDYGLLVTWMEIEENFVAAHGTGEKTPVSGKSLKTKTQAFNELAAYLNTHTKNANLPPITGQGMQQRWRTYKTKKFVPTLKKSRTETGLGMTKKEMRQGLSIQAKLDKLCPHFARMEKLFAAKANVQASATVELGVPQAPSTAGLHPRSHSVAGNHESSAEESADESKSDSVSDSGDDRLAASGVMSTTKDLLTMLQLMPLAISKARTKPDNSFEPSPPAYDSTWSPADDDKVPSLAEIMLRHHASDDDELPSVSEITSLRAFSNYSSVSSSMASQRPGQSIQGPAVIETPSSPSSSPDTALLPKPAHSTPSRAIALTSSTGNRSSQLGARSSKSSKKSRQAADTNTRKTKAQKKKTRSSSDRSDSFGSEKPKKMTAHESRASLSMAYAKNGGDKIKYMQNKLALDERMWEEQQKSNIAQQHFDQ